MTKPSTLIFNTAKKTATTALAGIGGTRALKVAGLTAVKHSSGKFIAAKLGSYVAGTIGAPALDIAAAPVITTLAIVPTVALLAGGVMALSRGM